jgi:shikimate kinase
MLVGRSYHNVALIGFMGVGKTTVGSLLAGMLGFEFLDTDRWIERREGCRIPEIFASRGEAAFREMEAALCVELEAVRGKVISTGGGLAVPSGNLHSLKRHSLVVCLWASPETVYRRVANHDHRPLLRTPDPLARIRELLQQRAPFYRQADVLVGVDFRSALETSRFIAASFRRLQKEGGQGQRPGLAGRNVRDGDPSGASVIGTSPRPAGGVPMSHMGNG